MLRTITILFLARGRNQSNRLVQQMFYFIVNRGVLVDAAHRYHMLQGEDFSDAKPENVLVAKGKKE